MGWLAAPLLDLFLVPPPPVLFNSCFAFSPELAGRRPLPLSILFLTSEGGKAQRGGWGLRLMGSPLAVAVAKEAIDGGRSTVTAPLCVQAACESRDSPLRLPSRVLPGWASQPSASLDLET